MPYHIESDIRRAQTLPGTFYNETAALEACREQVFARSWQLIPDAEERVKLPHEALPFSYMEGFLEEPLLLLRDGEFLGHPQASYGLSSGQVLDEIMGATSRTPD